MLEDFTPNGTNTRILLLRSFQQGSFASKPSSTALLRKYPAPFLLQGLAAQVDGSS